MKFYKILLVIVGVLVIVGLTAGITLTVQKRIHHKRFEKKLPYLAGLFGKEKPRDILGTIKMVRAIDVLSLNEEQIGKFITKCRKLDELKKEHQKARKEKLEEIEKLVEAKASSDELESAINSLEETEEKFRSDTEALRKEIQSILTIEQQAKLILFERDFQQQMQRFLERPHPGRKFLRKRKPCKEEAQKAETKGEEV